MWSRTTKPRIAAINGYALAGGWSIAQMCDIRLAAEDARLGITEPRVGLFPPFAVTLPKLIPMAAVMELVLTGEPVTGQRAYEMGFVNKVVPSDSLMDEGYWPILAAEWGAQVTGLKEQGEARWYSFAIALGAIAALSTGAWAVFRRKEL